MTEQRAPEGPVLQEVEILFARQAVEPPQRLSDLWCQPATHHRAHVGFREKGQPCARRVSHEFVEIHGIVRLAQVVVRQCGVGASGGIANLRAHGLLVRVVVADGCRHEIE